MRVLMLPRDPSPYLGSLIEALRRDGVRVRFAGAATPSATLNLLMLPLELAFLRLRGYRVLHVHWVFGFLPPWLGKVPGGRRLAGTWFRAVLFTARAFRMWIVWTAHNTLPHAPVFEDDLAMRRRLVAASHTVIHHSEGARAELAEKVAEPTRQMTIPHGPLASGPLRRRPEPGGGPPAFLFFGQVLGYKGVEELLEAFATLPEASATLTVAGSCGDPGLRARLEELAGPGVTLRLERVPESQLPALLGAHDVMVLPFRRVTTSGTALLGLEAAMPVVAPDHAGLSELPIQRYPPDDADGLRARLSELAGRSRGELRRLGEESRERLAQPSWDEIAGRTTLAYTGDARPRGALAARAAALWSEGLVRNSAWLMLNLAATAALGFVFFTILARSFSEADVGLVSTTLSTILLVSSVSALGFNYSLVRFLPEAPDRRTLVATALTLVGATSLIAAAVLLAIPPATAKLFGLGGVSFVATFAVANLLSSVKGILEGIFVADRDAKSIFSSNLAGAVAKIALLVMLVPVGPLAAVWAHVLALTIGLVLLTRRYRRSHDHSPLQPSFDWAAVKPLRRFSSGTYLATLLGGLPMMLLPIVVLARFGAEQAAYWNTAILIATLVFSLPGAVGQSLLAEGSHRPEERIRLVLSSARTMAVVMGPIIIGLLFAAPLILEVLGDSYAEEALLPLRLLLVSAVLVSANYVTGTILYLEKRVEAIVAINVACLVVVLGGSVLFAESAAGVGLCWLAGELCNVALFGVAAWRAVGRGSPRRHAIA